MPDSGFSILLDNGNILNDYAKIMQENFSESYIRNVILLDLSQKGSNCANIWLKVMSEKSLCQRYTMLQVVIMPELS